MLAVKGNVEIVQVITATRELSFRGKALQLPTLPIKAFCCDSTLILIKFFVFSFLPLMSVI